MFYIALLLLILLGVLAGIVIVQNFGTFSTSVHLTVLSWHLPGIPVLLLVLAGVFLGGLALYVVAAHSARRDRLEMKVLRAQIEELEKSASKTPSGGLVSTFAPSTVPIPGFGSGGPPGTPGPVSPPGPTGSPGPAGPQNQWQPPANSLQNMSPSASGNALPLPPRLFPQPQQSQQQQQQQQMGGPHPPFQHP